VALTAAVDGPFGEIESVDRRTEVQHDIAVIEPFRRMQRDLVRLAAQVLLTQGWSGVGNVAVGAENPHRGT
jgi:hypothetical protein